MLLEQGSINPLDKAPKYNMRFCVADHHANLWPRQSSAFHKSDREDQVGVMRIEDEF